MFKQFNYTNYFCIYNSIKGEINTKVSTLEIENIHIKLMDQGQYQNGNKKWKFAVLNS